MGPSDSGRLEGSARAPGTMGPYEVHELLGRGGLGSVHRGVDRRTGREVALKLLAATDERSRRRLIVEARALGRLRHRNVVALLEAGEERGRPWLALELVRGRSLDERLQREGPLPPDEAVRLVRALAAGLAHAHREGVLHRDLKPANVLLPADGGDPRLADFGLASLGAELDRSRLTRSGVFMGSPGWWSPEQAAGQASAVGPATDVYGLGALLFGALTGRPPIEGESLVAVLTNTADVRPTPPGVDGELDALVLRCLAKAPGDRPASVEVVARDLSRWLARRASGRRPALVGLALLLAATALAAGGAALAGGARRPAPDDPPASPAPAAASEAAPASDALPLPAEPAAEGASPSSLPLDVRLSLLNAAEAHLAHERHADARDTFEAVLAAEPANVTALVGRGAARKELGDAAGALADVEAAMALAAPGDPRPLRLRANLRSARGEHAAALADADAGVARAPDDPYSYFVRGLVHIDRGDFAAALLDLERAARGLPDDPKLLGELSRCREVAGDRAGALEALDRALSLRPTNVYLLTLRAQVSWNGGDLEATKTHCDRVLAVRPDAIALQLRANVRQRRGDLAGALADVEAALRLAPDDGILVGFRGALRAQAGDAKGALADFDRAIELGPEHPPTRENRAAVRRRLGDLRGALADYEVFLAARPDDVMALRFRGVCKAGLGDGAGGLADLDRAVALAPENGMVRANRARSARTSASTRPPSRTWRPACASSRPTRGSATS